MTGNPDGGDSEPVALEELIALRDGELSSDAEAQLLERVAGDPAAVERLRELDETNAVLGGLRERPAPPDVVEAIEQTLAREQARRESRVAPPADDEDGAEASVDST